MTDFANLPAIEGRFSIILVETDQNQLLLLKRRADAKFGGGFWGVPAGHIEPEENPYQCALREMEEETSIHFRNKPLQKIGPIRDTLYGGKFEIYLFHQRWESGDIQLNHEHTEFAWVSKADYPQYQVMDGIDEDILYFNIWPREYLNEEKLPT